MPAKNQKKRRTRVIPTKTSEVLDVKMAAELLTVSPDTIYDLFTGKVQIKKQMRMLRYCK